MLAHPLPPNPTPESSPTSLISNTENLRHQGHHQLLSDYCKRSSGGGGEGLSHPPPPLSISQPSTILGWSLSSEGMLAVPLPPEHLWLKTSSPTEQPVPGGPSQEPGRKIACEAWDSYTNFLASKKLLRCRICQTPMATRMSVCRMDHHNTRWLVLSLVCRKRSSRQRW